MRKCGRSNRPNGAGSGPSPLRLDARPALSLSFICALGVLSIGWTPALAYCDAAPRRVRSPVSAANGANGEELLASSETPSSSSSAALPSDATAAEPAASRTVSAALTPATSPMTNAPARAPNTGQLRAPQQNATAIPSALPTVSQGSTGITIPSGEAAGEPGTPVNYDDGLVRYEQAKGQGLNGPPLGSLEDFMSGGNFSSPLGIEVREARRKLKSGVEAQGLLIVDVFAGSPAARAGLRPYHRVMRTALETAAVAGAMFFPPVVLLVPVFDQVHLGESYDLIIGVDGARVTNFLDFEQRLSDIGPGEIVYFSIIRNGERKQIAVDLPAHLSSPTF
jgi:hypothetical protein